MMTPKRRLRHVKTRVRKCGHGKIMDGIGRKDWPDNFPADEEGVQARLLRDALDFLRRFCPAVQDALPLDKRHADANFDGGISWGENLLM